MVGATAHLPQAPQASQPTTVVAAIPASRPAPAAKRPIPWQPTPVPLAPVPLAPANAEQRDVPEVPRAAGRSDTPEVGSAWDRPSENASELTPRKEMPLAKTDVADATARPKFVPISSSLVDNAPADSVAEQDTAMSEEVTPSPKYASWAEHPDPTESDGSDAGVVPLVRPESQPDPAGQSGWDPAVRRLPPVDQFAAVDEVELTPQSSKDPVPFYPATVVD